MAKKIVTKVPAKAGKGKEGKPGKGEKEKESIRIVLSKIEATLRTAIQNIGYAINHLAEAKLDEARDAAMRAMDIVVDEKISDQLNECAAEIQNKMDAIEELEAELL